MILQLAQQTEVGPTPRGARRFGGDWQAALGGSVELEKRRQRRSLTRLISASLLSCRALSKPKAFPPGGDKEAAGEAGGLSPGRALSACAHSPRAADPTERPARTGGGRGPPGAGRGVAEARAGGPGGGAGARAGGGTAMPTLEPVAERDRHGEHPAPAGSGLRGRQRGTRRRGGRLVRARAACGGGTVGRRDGAGGGTLPSPLPPRPARPASPPLCSPPPASKRLLCGTPSPPACPSAGGRGKCTARGPPGSASLSLSARDLFQSVPAPAAVSR